MVVDDHAQVRQGLSTFLGLWDDLVLADEAENGQQAVDLIEKFQPACHFDGPSGASYGWCCCNSYYPAEFSLGSSSHFDLDLVHQAMKAGAKSYMFKNVTIDTMAQTIRSAAQ